ncbi:Vernalization5/VIN3-like, putative isoform 2 [Hibiscus syriacus]|uniref:Vernalization5/VIN3-like, putative isoform 2 n=1 Tax=Hibiscus syriacus TaxID=106335 RepID=A0A6A3B9S9_HIBSY|nr:VIN3-like protein 2 isoform X1 [Hibiscus syriacus]KAE8713810.1 Vernalization5/VIN3-like, putative isoform 2 [Hibiscus syriacus]
MDSSFEGVALDPSKCSKLSMGEKRELVYELSKRTNRASEMLQSWSRQEILQILCAEMGKERKYTGLTKLKIIENLLKIVAEKNSGDREGVADPELQSSPTNGQKTSKRQRKADHPCRLPVLVNDPPINNSGNDMTNAIYCKNSACRASLRQDDTFCKRCSCCICYKFDDNKDPSLWLICSSEPPFQGNSCGMSCHLECALKHEKSGFRKDKRHAGLDGSFYCVRCGKVNDLLGCWRKQLMAAKDTRRVDILCYRASLGQKLLNGTQKYQKLSEIVDEAVKMLEAEVGPLTGVPVKMGRGIVNRLSSGQEVQRLCSSAVELLDKMIFDTISNSSPDLSLPAGPSSKSPAVVRFEDVQPTSLTVIVGSEETFPDGIIGYTLWHRKVHDRDYPVKSTCTLFVPNRRYIVTGLTPATEYYFKIVSFDGKREFGPWEVPISTASSGDEVPSCPVMGRSQSPATNCSSLSNPSSVEDETNNNTPHSDQNDDRADNYVTYCKDTEKIIPTNLSEGATNRTVLGEDGIPADEVSLLGADHAMEIVGPMPDSDVLDVEKKQTSEDPINEETSTDNGSDAPVQTGTECVPFVGCSEAGLPVTPCRMEIVKDVQGRSGRCKSSNKDRKDRTGKGDDALDGSSSKKRNGERRDEECVETGVSEVDFEHCVKVIRWLECKGHIEKNFRQKFLTWYSLRATPQEVRIVKVFVGILSEDPASLAEQLVDTFSDCISSKKTYAGLCMKLWH